MVVFVFSTFYSYRCSYGTSVKMIQNPMYLDSRMEKKKKTEHAQPFISIFTAFLRIKKSILNQPCSRLLCVVTAAGWESCAARDGAEHGERGRERGGEGKRGARGAALLPKASRERCGAGRSVRPLGRGGCQVCSPRSRTAEPEC